MFGAASDEARANGELDGIDSFMTNGGPGDIITSNVTPYAKTNALFLSKRAAQALSDAQLGILRQAAAEALGTSLAELPVTDDHLPTSVRLAVRRSSLSPRTWRR